MPRVKQTARKFKPVQKSTSTDAMKNKATGLKPGGVKKARRFKPGTVALREIRRQQKLTTNIIPRAPFSRLVREIAQNASPVGMSIRFKADAIQALRVAAEAHIINVFEKTQKAAIHRDSVTIRPKDMRLALDLGGIMSGAEFNEMLKNMSASAPSNDSNKENVDPQTSESAAESAE